MHICPTILPVALADTDRAKTLLGSSRGISVRDAVHAAVMLNHDVSKIATFDAGFDAIAGVRRVALR
ncbi:MAG: type II toxin-antitoxin system VapC family toxin [Acidobacteria bacterium]|nr:type II toxin-antitoxin system VapC family toxin [Acidobacteriota bacterium]